MKYQIEVTDTFGGEANYCWVRRETVELPEYGPRRTAFRRRMLREVRRVTGWPVSVRLNTSDYGDDMRVDPRGMCQVCFVSFVEGN